MKIAELAKKLGTTQKALKEAAGNFGIEIKSTTKELDEASVKKLEDHFTKKETNKSESKEKKSKEKKEPAKVETKRKEKAPVVAEPEIPEELLVQEEQTGTSAIVEEVERDLEREIMKEQKKQKLASGKPAVVEKTEDTALSLQPKKTLVQLPSVISVKEFAEKVSVPINKIIAELMKNGLIVTINHKIDFDTAAIIADAFGIQVEKTREDVSSEDLLLGNLENLLKNEDKSKLLPRPAIVSIMGHVDHGKTKLLDYIRQTNVIDTEAGGITQKIGAYQVTYKDQKITFLDTPGHEAFTAMRARGAKATDIAILVVAADEGVKPQTKEAYDHIKEANIPVIVAINKIDKPGANLEMAKNQLTEMGLIPEEWGGTTIIVPVSAMTGQGVEDLLEMILLVAGMHTFQANPDHAAIGTVIESNLDPKLGPVATILINTGTLHVMDTVVVGEAYGRVKVMLDHTLNKIKSALPSTPVQIAGLSEVPMVGDILQVEVDPEKAKEKAMEIKALREAKLQSGGAGGMSDIIAKIHAGQLKTLKIVLKADSKGSMEAIRASIDKIQSQEVEAKVIHSSVGNITETDVLMASAGGGIVMGFNVDKSVQVDKVAEREKVEVRTYRVIYQMLDDITKILLGLLDPEVRETITGEAEVLAVFLKDKKGMILGARVSKGKIESKLKVRVIRKDKLVAEGAVPTLRREKENVPEVKEGYECGIRYDGPGVIETGDILQFYKIEKIKKESL